METRSQRNEYDGSVGGHDDTFVPGVDKGDAMENVAISLELVESMVKDFKTHRCALDFEKKFIKQEAERH